MNLARAMAVTKLYKFRSVFPSFLCDLGPFARDVFCRPIIGPSFHAALRSFGLFQFLSQRRQDRKGKPANPWLSDLSATLKFD
jgi:hypothetical protein